MAAEAAGLGLLGGMGLFALAGSSLLEGISSWNQGEAAYSTGKINAQRLEQQALKSRQMTALNLYRQKKYADQVEGSQIASIAHSGGRLDDPTSQAILKDTALEASIDEWLIKNAGTQEYYNLKTEASNQRAQARAARAAGRMGAISSLLGGGANTYFSYKGLVS